MKNTISLHLCLAWFTIACLNSANSGLLGSDCSKTSTGMVPLNELGGNYYMERQGGLYPDGQNLRPVTHDAAGFALAHAIQSLDAAGKADVNGRVVLISIGMSNASVEFSAFKALADADPAKNPKLAIVDGAQAGMSADRIYDMSTPSAVEYWSTVDSRLRAAGVTAAQVQIAWLKEADDSPTEGFPLDSMKLKEELVSIVRIMKSRFPNLALTYLSSRIYGGYATTLLNPEPFAYQSGFAVKGLIEDQINGRADLNYDPKLGSVKASWLAWGPYLWADGINLRNDGLSYVCSDFGDDGSSPGRGASEKVAQMLLEFFKRDSTALLWFSGSYVLRIPRLMSSNSAILVPGGAEYTGFALANLGVTQANVRFTAYDANGNLVQGSDITNPGIKIIADGSQAPAISTEIFGAGLEKKTSTGWIRMDSSVGTVAGFFLVFDPALNILDGVEATPDARKSFVLPEVEDSGFTEIHIANPGVKPASVMLELIGPDGRPAASVSRQIDANGALSSFTSSIFAPATVVGGASYLRLTSDSPVTAMEMFGRTGKYLAAINGEDPEGGGTTLYCPQYATGGVWSTALSVVNLEARSGQLTFELFSDDGSPLAPAKIMTIAAGGKVYINQNNFFLDPAGKLVQGYIRITSSGPRVCGSATFGDPARAQFGSTLPLVVSLKRVSIFGHLASNADYFTGLAILNPGKNQAAVRIQVFDRAGRMIGDIQNMAFAPGQRRSRLLTEYFPDLKERDFTSGYFKITSDQGMACFALFGTNNLSALSAIPPQRFWPW